MATLRCNNLAGCRPALLSGRPAARVQRRVVRPLAATTWTVEIYSHTPFDESSKSNIDIQILAKETGKESAATSVNKWDVKYWDVKNELLPGRIRSGEVSVEDDFGTPGGVILTKKPGVDQKSLINFVKLKKGSEEFYLPCNSMLWADGKPRVVFTGAALPKDTPAGLTAWRTRDMEEKRGTPEQAVVQRQEGERIYDYDVINDLGRQAPGMARRTLGSKEFPYGRRLRTGRPIVDGQEMPPEDENGYWLPPDEAFTYTKDKEISRGKMLATLPVMKSMLEAKLGKKKEFTSFKEIYSLLDPEGKGLESLLPKELAFAPMQKDAKSVDLGKILKLNETGAKVAGAAQNAIIGGVKLKAEALVDKPGEADNKFFKPLSWLKKASDWELGALRSLKTLLAGVDDISDVTKFQVPTVFLNRPDAWHSDEEWGRQLFAGTNPVLVGVAKGLPAGTTITEGHVKELLEGNTLDGLFQQATTKPRLFWLDLWPVYEPFLGQKIEFSGAIHTGRTLLFKRSDGNVVPIAIELKHEKSGPSHVYTPKDAPQVWLLAKTVMNNLDYMVHNGYSHHMRAHVCVESYIISAHRNLSALHPLYQLLHPHFKYTLNINNFARRTMIKANGPFETDFTVGMKVLDVVAKGYELLWHFDTEALPNDLKARGFMDADGKMLVEDYPYAEDGMLIYNSLHKYLTEYIDLYYKSDADITADPELNTWWTEIQVKGHPEKTTGWPSLKTKGDLVNILSSMIWIMTAYHGALNFPQYDYSLLPHFRPSFIRKPMPVAGSADYKKLAESKGADFEKLYLSYVSDRVQTAHMALVYKLLSSHSMDEKYLTDTDHAWFKTGAAKEVLERFAASMKNVEVEINARNADPSKKFRNRETGGLPYIVLLPESTPGLTGKGVPYSVSI